MNVGKKTWGNPIPSQHNTQRGVTVGPSKNGLRIRWRYKSQKKELYIASSNPNSQPTANTIRQLISEDLSSGTYDETLNRYRAALQDLTAAGLKDLVGQHQQSSPTLNAITRDEPRLPKPDGKFEVLKEFERYVSNKGATTEKNYYYYTKRMFQRWEQFDLEDTPILVMKEYLGNQTFNDRRNCLFKFFEWAVTKRKITENPLADLKNKRKGKVTDRRIPFTDSEAVALLDAFKTNRFYRSQGYPHSQYYPFLAFMLHTGVRNGEAIGLKVREVNFEKGEIRIATSLARTRQGTYAKARVLKGTKTDNVRFLTLEPYLFEILQPLCKGKILMILFLSHTGVFRLTTKRFSAGFSNPYSSSRGSKTRPCTPAGTCLQPGQLTRVYG